MSTAGFEGVGSFRGFLECGGAQEGGGLDEFKVSANGGVVDRGIGDGGGEGGVVEAPGVGGFGGFVGCVVGGEGLRGGWGWGKEGGVGDHGPVVVGWRVR